MKIIIILLLILATNIEAIQLNKQKQAGFVAACKYCSTCINITDDKVKNPIEAEEYCSRLSKTLNCNDYGLSIEKTCEELGK